MIKTNTGVNPYYIAPNAGTIQSGAYSGLAKTRQVYSWNEVDCSLDGTVGLLREFYPPQ
jgi:hypothetical protein